MATGSRTLKLSILADVADLTKGLTSGTKEVETFGDKVADFGKKAGAAFLAAGAAAAAYAGKLAIDGVKAAIADEAAQQKLATTLRNVTGATDEAISSTEDFISRLALATGVADDDLRPALDRLIRSGLGLADAQDTLKLALDVSAGSGKGLEAVANALGKAYEGNTTALGKLGLGISSAELKTMSFEQVTAQLAATFKDQASIQADTFQGKMARVRVAFDEAKETLGMALLPVIERFADYLITTLIPAIQKWIDENGPKLVKVLTEFVIPAITATVTSLSTIVSWVADNAEIIKSIGTVLLAGLAAAKVTATISTIVTALGTLAAAYTAVGVAATGAGVATATSAGAAAAGATSWAALAKNVNLVSAAVSAAVAGFMLVKKGLEALVDAFKSWGETYLRNLLGLGSGGGSSSSRTPVYSSNPNLIGLRGYNPNSPVTTPIPTVPTVPTQAQVAAQQEAAAFREVRQQIAETQTGLSNTLDKLNAYAAKELEKFGYYDRASTGAVINFNAPVVSDPETLARLVNDTMNNSANRTGNYTSLGVSTTSLPLAAL